MAYQERDNTGALFKNDRKEQETHPDYRGPCTVNGERLEVSAWLKKTKNGDKYLSLSFRPHRDQGNRQSSRRNDDDFMP